MIEIRETPQGLVFKVFIQPRSSKNSIEGIHGDALKVKVKAPPVDGAANSMVVKFLAGCLSVKKAGLRIVSGKSSRTKSILYIYDSCDPSQEEIEGLKQSIQALVSS